MHQEPNSELHAPVLLAEVLRYLTPKQGESYLDLTAGYGGHAAAVIERTAAEAQAVLVDRDQNAQAVLAKRLPLASRRQQTFEEASKDLLADCRQFDMILADLGVSSPHLNDAARGFSFTAEAPLDMRMDQTQELTAEIVVNTWPEPSLARILREYGEEPKAANIAQRIVDSRPISTTVQLAEIAKRAWPGHSRVHPATRTFQAIRIAVNDEREMLERSLPLWLNLLAPGGRLAIISFHSLEDRIVKRFLTAHAGNRYDAELQLLTKRPVSAEPNEIVFNPRSRSAKLRVAVKTKTK
jgi:16S rRNA (cytosine1402-N4)-methyltransferase